MIELKNISKTYEGDTYKIEALKNINLTINDGDFIAIMGKSGSGKTTLLNGIGMMDTFSEGEYFLDGEDIMAQKQSRLGELRKEKISFIFQHFELLNSYTAYENIEIPLLAKNIKAKKRKELIHENAGLLGVEDLLDKYPQKLSGGQQQRIAIARAMVSDNPVILADEPTGALDSNTAKELLDVLTRINEMGRTILIVTHDINVAEHCKRIIRLQDGQIS